MEIEVKLLPVPGATLAGLGRLQWPNTLGPLEKLTLGNRYFDTPDLALRRQDMGLRVRRKGEFREQTLKTAGKVVGGLHARPEFNVTIEADMPDLSLFPAELWPQQERDAIQANLAAQFSTDFERETAELTLTDGARVELALDRGTISAGNKSEAIEELELELVQGDAQQLLELARVLMEQAPLRLGLDSKAARGYRLAGLAAAPTPLTPSDRRPVNLLQAWQVNEGVLLAGNDAALGPLCLVLTALAEQSPDDEVACLNKWVGLLARHGAEALPELFAQREYGLVQLYWLERVLASS